MSSGGKKKFWKPNLVARELVSVQPLSAPIGKLYYLDKKFTVNLYREIIILKNEL